MEEPNDDLEAPDEAMRRPSPTLVAASPQPRSFALDGVHRLGVVVVRASCPVKLTAVLLEQGVHHLNIRRGGH